MSKSATSSICFQICKPTNFSMLEMSITSSSIYCRNAQRKPRRSIKLSFPFVFPDVPRLSKSPTTLPLPQVPYITKSKSKLKPTVRLLQFRSQRLCLCRTLRGEISCAQTTMRPLSAHQATRLLKPTSNADLQTFPQYHQDFESLAHHLCQQTENPFK